MITYPEQAGWQVFFEASFSPKPDGRRPGRELPLNRTFLWDGASCHIPSVYLCEEGLVLDVLLQADTEAVKAWIERWGLTPETETGDLSPEQEMRIQNENPLHRDFSPAVCLNGQRFKFAEGCSFVWLSFLSTPTPIGQRCGATTVSTPPAAGRSTVLPSGVPSNAWKAFPLP